MTDTVRAGRPPGAGANSPCAITLAAWLNEGLRGIADVRTPSGACRLQLDAGSLRVAPGDPLAAANDGAAAEVETLIALLASATTEALHFTPTATAPAAGRSLPAGRLLMEAAVRGRERAQLWTLVGGRPVFLRMAGGSKLAIESLRSAEPPVQALLARFVKGRRAAEVVGEDAAGLETLRDLARLRVVGLLAPADSGDEAPSGITGNSRDLFLRRIERELERRPLRINPDEHRRRLTDLLRNLGIFNYYQLLGVERHADERAIHQAYVDVAGVAHPSHAPTLGLDDKTAALDLLFEVATEAYLVLSHPDRRRAYDHGLPPDTSGPASEERRREKAGVARDMYTRARRLAMEQEFQAVLELMQQAVQLDPQAEYYALLGDVQRRNPQWHAGALQSYRDAVRCRPNDADLRLAFAQVLEQLGDRKQAEVQYRAALELRPGDQKLQEAFDLVARGPRRKKAAGRTADKKDDQTADGKGGDDDGGMFPTFKALFRRGKR